jgi:hypothetical protein
MERKPAQKQVTVGLAMADFQHFNTEKAPFRRRAAGATATRS